MEIQLGDYKINVIVIRKNNKNIYFRFKDDGNLYVTCNYLVTNKEIIKLLKKDEKSMLRMYKFFIKREEINKQFYYLGEPYIIVNDDKIKEVMIENNTIYVKDEKMLNKWYKSECKKIFTERINLILHSFNNIPSFSLRIRKMKTRWGVNNVTKRIITLNSELLKKDVTLIDYVIIHELCHFYEANHSAKFWKQVEKRYPYYKLARKRLKVE